MMIPGGARRQKGVSLLELLISIMLLTVVMMTFAMVFPGGYRLNLKNRMESRAAKYANGIMYKLQNIPFNGTSPTSPTIENLQNWDLGVFPDEFERTLEPPFFLPARNQPDPGIRVQILDPTLPPPAGGGTLAKISVTVAWVEVTKARVNTKKVTVVSYRSKNH